MSGRWSSGLLVATLVVSVVNSRIDLDSPLRLAHCRATCLYKMEMTHVTDSGCQAHKYCSQCWDTCHLLQDSEGTAAGDHVKTCSQRACGRGCLEACRFHSVSPGQKSPVLLTEHEETLDVTSRGVSWPPPAPGVTPVYVVMGQVVGQPWSQLCQTLDPNARVSSDVDLESVRVLVVDWRGLTKVFSPHALSPLTHARTIIRSVGMEKQLGQGQQIHTSNSTKLSPETSVKDTPAKLWRLREVSMIHQTALVLAQISWDPQLLETGSQVTYLVTWELGKGILRGNLITNSSCVTLSLWPDTVYRIQVAVLSPESPESQSEPLELDTRHVHSKPPVTVHHALDTLRQTRPADTPRQTQLVAAVAAAVAVFLVVTLTLTWRWRHTLSLPHSKLLDEDSDTPKIYRVFPPAVRLIGERQDVSPDIFSSMDRLIITQQTED